MAIVTWLADLTNAVRAVAVLTGVALLLSMGQVLADRALLGGFVMRGWPTERLRIPLIERLLRNPRNVLFAGSIAAAAVIVAAAFNASLFGPLLFLALCNSGVAIRFPLVITGAERMSYAVTVALLLGTSGSGTAMAASLWFIAGMAILAYTTAGLLKSTQRSWYNGSAITGLMATDTFGHERAAAFFETHHGAARIAGSGVALGETLFASVLLMPPWAATIALGAAALGHGIIAALMGLNVFFWSFTATYPAILYCVIALQRG